VKPFVKRHKNDAADAEAICEAVQRPNMRFVTVKSEEQQASALVFRTRDLLVGQRTQTINAIRGHMTEYGWVAPKGSSWVTMLGELIEDEVGASLPNAAREMFRVMLDMLEKLDCRIADLDKEIARRAREDGVARRLMTIPGIGPIARQRSRHWHRQRKHSNAAATLLPGSGSHPCRNQRVERPSWAEHPRWVNVHCGDC